MVVWLAGRVKLAEEDALAIFDNGDGHEDGAFENDLPAGVAAFGAENIDPIRLVGVVLVRGTQIGVKDVFELAGKDVLPSRCPPSL